MEQSKDEPTEGNSEEIQLEQVVESLCSVKSADVDTLAQDENEIKETELVTITTDVGHFLRPSLVIIEAESTSPAWAMIEIEVNRILKEYMQKTSSRFVVYQKTSKFLKPGSLCCNSGFAHFETATIRKQQQAALEPGRLEAGQWGKIDH